MSPTRRTAQLLKQLTIFKSDLEIINRAALHGVALTEESRGTWSTRSCQQSTCSSRGRPHTCSNFGAQSGRWRGFASKAEEYDIISVDSGLARIEGHDAGGFLVNSAYLEGAVICSANLAALWSVKDLSAVTSDSLALLLLMRPPPDLLVLGCGPRIQPPPAGLQEWLASQGVALECLDTANAVSTFNILNQEGRTVVAALLPSS